jgi:hypothetical protein
MVGRATNRSETTKEGETQECSLLDELVSAARGESRALVLRVAGI